MSASPLPNLRSVVAHPATIISTVTGIVAYAAQIPFIDVVAGTLWNQAGVAFGATAALSTQVAPVVPLVDANTLRVLSIIFGAVFGFRGIYRIVSSIWKKLREDNE